MPRTRNWLELKNEWLASGESLNAFRARKRLNTNSFYKIAREHKWRERKSELTQKIDKKMGEKLVDKKVDDFLEYRNIFKASKAQVLSILKKTIDDDGIVRRPLSTLELQQLVKAVYQILQGESFIQGGPTQRIDSRNIHMDIVDFIEKMEKEDRIIDEK